MSVLEARAGSGQTLGMRNINSHCLSTVLAAVLLGLSSCSNPPVKSDRMEPASTGRDLPEEIMEEMGAAEESAEEAAEESMKRVAQDRTAVEPGMSEEFPADFLVEDTAAAEPTMKVMGPWAAGDQIDSGRDGVKPIEILQVHANGSGDVCGSGKRATLRYVAMKADGTVVDPGKRPFTFRVDSPRGAIAGWDIVVAKMRVGDSFTLVVPSKLAYGAANGDYKFDMELLAFE